MPAIVAEPGITELSGGDRLTTSTVARVTVQFEEIHTPRLLLRRLAEADREAVVNLHSNPDTYLYSQAPTRAEADAKFDSWLREWDDHGFSYVPVCARDSGELLGIGGVQLRDFGGETILNLYYRFAPENHGKGYATEMAAAVVDWAEEKLPEYPVQISVQVTNQASMNVAKRLGFLTYVETLHEGYLTRHFRR
jgi:RimJ/RimL family protein N-acetyltransferase